MKSFPDAASCNTSGSPQLGSLVLGGRAAGEGLLFPWRHGAALKLVAQPYQSCACLQLAVFGLKSTVLYVMSGPAERGFSFWLIESKLGVDTAFTFWVDRNLFKLKREGI